MEYRRLDLTLASFAKKAENMILLKKNLLRTRSSWRCEAFGGVKFTKLWSVLKELLIEDITEKMAWNRKCN